MQITETLSDGLKRELKIVIAANELDERLNSKLDELKDKVHLKGFRPGKVPSGSHQEGLRPLRNGGGRAAGGGGDDGQGHVGPR